MITIAAAARSKVVGEDATALSRLNAGLTSSLFEQINDEYIAIDVTSSLDNQYKSTVDDYITFLKNINMSATSPNWDPVAFSSYTSVLNNFIAYSQQLKVEATSSATTSTGFIPINVSLKMTGMSGMKIYQEFTLKTDFLPSNYQTQMSWLIKGVNHTIENNMWSTTIESLSLPKTTTKPSSIYESLKTVLAKSNSNETVIVTKIPSIEATAAELELYYKTILANLGAPATIGNILFLKAWRQAEGGQAIWNGFNTTFFKTGSTNFNTSKVKNYLSLEDGAAAISDTIKNKKYANLLKALKAGIKDQKAAEKLALELQQPYKDLWIWVNGPNAFKPALEGYVAGVLKGTVRDIAIYKPK